MYIKLENFKSIRKDMEWDLKGINIFIGGPGTGKSLVSDFLKLFAKNHQIEGCEKGNFSGACKCESLMDWRNYTYHGQLKDPTVIARSVSFVGMEPLETTGIAVRGS